MGLEKFIIKAGFVLGFCDCFFSRSIAVSFSFNSICFFRAFCRVSLELGICFLVDFF